MSQSGETVSLDEAVGVLRELRRSLGLGPERFSLPAFVGMISDEIEQMRGAGKSDDAIAAMIAATLGRPFDPKLIERYYAPPEERGAHG